MNQYILSCNEVHILTFKHTTPIRFKIINRQIQKQADGKNLCNFRRYIFLKYRQNKLLLKIVTLNVTQNQKSTYHIIFNLRLINTFNNNNELKQLIYRRNNKLSIKHQIHFRHTIICEIPNLSPWTSRNIS